MKRYCIPSFEVFFATWNRAQFYLAIDAIFWNSAKERDKFGSAPKDSDLSNVRASDLLSVLGLG